jgi:hypothetical protein
LSKYLFMNGGRGSALWSQVYYWPISFFSSKEKLFVVFTRQWRTNWLMLGRWNWGMTAWV